MILRQGVDADAEQAILYDGYRFLAKQRSTPLLLIAKNDRYLLIFDFIIEIRL